MERDFEVKDGKGRKPNQRMKHFLVLQYLMENTDVNHPAKTQEIVDYLKGDCGIYTERRSIYKDVEEINIAYVMQELKCSYEEAVEELEVDEDLATIRYRHKSGFYVARRPRAFRRFAPRFARRRAWVCRHRPRRTRQKGK